MQTEVRHERWDLAAPFVIAHETYLHADVIVATLSCDGAVGRGECTPTAFYGESVDGVMKTVRELLARLARGESWDRIHDRVPAGAARNAVDCAFWDLRAKLAKRRVWELAGIPAPAQVRTAQTISVGEAAQQADKARAIVATDGDRALIKLKLDVHDVVARVAASHPEAKVLFVSGYDEGSLDRYGVPEARAAFLQKPFTPATLTAKVREVMEASPA